MKNSELEQEFYNTFGIEPEYTYIGHYPLTDENGIIQPPTYPDITAEKLLEMICVLNNYFKYNCWASTVTTLKYAILENCVEVVVDKLLDDDVLEQFKHRIKQLFKGGE